MSITDTNNTIKTLALLLEEKRIRERKEERKQDYEKVKDILLFIAICGTCIFAPNALRIFKPLLPKKEYFSSKTFNKRYLKWQLNRLAKSKVIDIKENGKEKIVSITQKGEKRILKYVLNELEVSKPKSWDCKWRIVIYDIANQKKSLYRRIRDSFLNLGFLAIQKSVFLFPYPCQKEAEFLRSFYNLDKEIKLITACDIEDEEVYKEYFGLEKKI